MNETHDPRSVTRTIVPLYVEIVPQREDYAMRYVGGVVHEIVDPVADADGERSMERFSPEDIASAIMANLWRDLDSMWRVSRVAPTLTCLSHEQARAAGLSDPEARADGWPDRRAEGIAAINAEIEKWASEPASAVPSPPFADLAERLFDLQPAYCPYDCDSCHDDTCPCDRAGCAGGVAE